jgi:hypothetical protein
MKLDPRIEQEVEAVMEQGRQIRPAPDVVRARLLARARAAFAASAASPAAIPAISTPTAWRGRRIAVAASLLLVFVAAAATAAFHGRVTRAPEIAPAPPRFSDLPAVRALARGLPPEQPTQPAPITGTKRPHRSITPQESYTAELQLLQRAQSEYASHDFGNALMLLAEHGRRFPKGRLAEEREALRVRSLARAGRDDEARRALASFVNRFPHSAFLPRLRAAAGSADE